MSQEWLKKYLHIKPEVNQIFDDLDNYRRFCQDYGYFFDEKDLYNERTSYGEYIKMTKGKEPWDQWRSPPRKKDFNNGNGHYRNRNRNENTTRYA